MAVDSVRSPKLTVICGCLNGSILYTVGNWISTNQYAGQTLDLVDSANNRQRLFRQKQFRSENGFGDKTLWICFVLSYAAMCYDNTFYALTTNIIYTRHWYYLLKNVKIHFN